MEPLMFQGVILFLMAILMKLQANDDVSKVSNILQKYDFVVNNGGTFKKFSFFLSFELRIHVFEVDALRRLPIDEIHIRTEYLPIHDNFKFANTRSVNFCNLVMLMFPSIAIHMQT
jgi:hypothetical protein